MNRKPRADMVRRFGDPKSVVPRYFVSEWSRSKREAQAMADNLRGRGYRARVTSGKREGLSGYNVWKGPHKSGGTKRGNWIGLGF